MTDIFDIAWKGSLELTESELPPHARGDGMGFGSQLLLYLYIKLIIAYIQSLCVMPRQPFHNCYSNLTDKHF